MHTEMTLTLDDRRAELAAVGGKGASLARLAAAGLPVPDGFHITTAAYDRFVAGNELWPHIQAALEQVDLERPASLESAAHEIKSLFAGAEIPPEIAGAIASAYGRFPGRDPVVAVRSSATAEDLPEFSFAGQQETFLNRQGITALLEAVQRCWASLWTARAIGYRQRNNIPHAGVSLAVVVQVLVPAESAGIMFTANPINGRRDQILINAAWGLGEAVVGGAVTPDSIVIDRQDLRVVERQTAEKSVMTVRVNGDTREQPVPDALQNAPALDDQAAVELAHLGIQIDELYGHPSDIEWALADGELAILQARPITALPAPEAPPPSEWPMPDPKGMYMRTSIIDMLPDPLSPLFATLGIQTMEHTMDTMIQKLSHTDTPTFESPILLTINNYAYMSGRFTAKEWWRMIVRLVPPLSSLIRRGVQRWRETDLPIYQAHVQRWENQPLDDLNAVELYQGAQDLLKAVLEHLAFLQAETLGASAGSEGLFTAIYNRVGRREGDPPAPTFLMGYNTTPIRAEKSLYDLASWSHEHAGLSSYLLETPSHALSTALAQSQAPAAVDPEHWRDFTQRFQTHMDEFGHLIYELDFAKPLPLDDPAVMLETIKMYLRGEGADPHTRQERLAHERETTQASMMKRLGGIKRWAFRNSLNWAQTLAQAREDSIAAIGLGYPRLRQMLSTLGERLVEAGAISEASDIYWLEHPEIEQTAVRLDQGNELESYADLVAARQATWRGAKRVVPPPALPPTKKYMGFDLESFMPSGEDAHTATAINGIGASPGQATGVARVLHGPEDFDQMQPGDVLVAKLTTPAWTPLFAMAAAVVTDIGGPLSHGSIVAREYGIPAVLGTGVATRRIQSGQTITVDGDRGQVRLNGQA